MQDKFDPEKQFYSDINNALQNYAKNYKNYIYAKDGDVIIEDIGREWRAGRKIEKNIVDGTSIWVRRDQ